MGVPQNFRISMRGFNREDVVHYLEYLNTRHQNQVNQMAQEMEALRSQLQAQPQTVVNTEVEDALREAYAAALQENDALRAEKAALEGQLEALRAQLQQSEEARKALESQPVAAPVEVQPELDTYRRAQNVEKESKMRAELVYYQTNGVLTEACAKVDGVAEELTALADQTMRELTKLQVAVSESKHTLQDTANLMRSIRPNS